MYGLHDKWVSHSLRNSARSSVLEFSGKPVTTMSFFPCASLENRSWQAQGHVSKNHSLCGSYKLLYKQCVLSMWRSNIWPPVAQKFGERLIRNSNFRNMSRGHSTCQIWLRTYDRIKGVGGADSQFVTSLVLPFLLLARYVPNVAKEEYMRSV